MSEVSFPVNDLLRRRFQTALVVFSLASSVASTLLLLLFADRTGISVLVTIQGKMTVGFAAAVSPFISLLVILILIVGVVTASFMTSLMMRQRTRDIGLMKAAGCPNDIMFGYFFTELLIVVVAGCLSGVLLGFVADLVLENLTVAQGQVLEFSFNFWLAVLVFVIFFVSSLIVGSRPILQTAKIAPSKAISPSQYMGVSSESRSQALTGSSLVLKLAVRSLIRHKSATIMTVLCLSSTFTLVTVGIAGGLIADNTTRNWIERAIGRNVIMVAHQSLCDQYSLLLRKFIEGSRQVEFDYVNEDYLIDSELLGQLQNLNVSAALDGRLVMWTTVNEMQGVVLGSSSIETRTVGDSRKSDALVVGVEPDKAVNDWFLKGDFLDAGESSEAVIGDTLAREVFSEPLVQKMKAFEKSFDVVGVCLDPLNNGRVVYVSLSMIQNRTGIFRPNLVLIRLDSIHDQEESLAKIRSAVAAERPEFSVFQLDDILEENLSFLGSVWSSVMLIPLFCLTTASLCLVGYVTLTLDEQRHELGVLRALGVRPRKIFTVVSLQNILVLLSSYGVGTAIGIILTLLILVEEPVITASTVLEVAAWLALALFVTSVSGSVLALRFAKKPLPEMIRQT